MDIFLGRHKIGLYLELSVKVNNTWYALINSEINAYQKQIKMVFSQSETI